jgi:hypothetical protein
MATSKKKKGPRGKKRKGSRVGDLRTTKDNLVKGGVKRTRTVG